MSYLMIFIAAILLTILFYRSSWASARFWAFPKKSVPLREWGWLSCSS